MNPTIIRETFERSKAGTISFPDVVQQLLAQGVESYQVDLVRDEIRVYFPDGGSLAVPLGFPHSPVAERFDAPAVEAAVRASQRKEIDYREFLTRALAAGTAGYTACLTGKKVLYLGRQGDLHVEHFPQPARATGP